jgi:hypothetical protein
MSNLSEASKALMTAEAVDTTATEATTADVATTTTESDSSAESDESDEPDSSSDASAEADASAEVPKEDVFKLDANDTPFKNLLAARDAGEDSYKLMLTAFSAVWGKDVEVIQDGFNNTIKAEKAKAEIVTFDKDLAGYTPANSLIRLLQEGLGIATDGGGSVTFSIVLVKGEMVKGENGEDDKMADDTASISASWRGIDGMTSRRGGGGGGGRYQYFDGGVLVEGSLKKHILDKRSGSYAAGRIRKNDADLAAGKKGRLSAFVAATDGKSDGDSFVITRGDKVTADSTPSS